MLLIKRLGLPSQSQLCRQGLFFPSLTRRAIAFPPLSEFAAARGLVSAFRSSCWVWSVTGRSAARGCLRAPDSCCSPSSLSSRDPLHRRVLGVPEFYGTLPQRHLQHPAVRPDQRAGAGNGPCPAAHHHGDPLPAGGRQSEAGSALAGARCPCRHLQLNSGLILRTNDRDLK